MKRPPHRPRMGLLRLPSALRAALLGVLALGLLPGCTSLAPPYQAPPLPVPATLQTGTPATEEAPPLAPAAVTASDFVQDERLRALLDMALAGNRDLRVAVLAVERARAQYGIAQADRLPTLNASGNAGRTRTADDLTAAGRGNTSNQYSVGAGLAGFELDFWGRVRNLNEVALQEFLRSEDQQASARISLASELALAWVGLDADARRLQLARATLAARERQLELTRRSHALGAASGLTLAQVQTTVDGARTEAAAYEAQVARGRNVLALLAGAPVPPRLLPPGAQALRADGPSSVAARPSETATGAPAEAAPLPPPVQAAALPEVPADLPSSVLLARPDIRAAERALQAAHAQIGAARAAFFPSISLTASVGTASNELSGLFAGGNHTWSFAPQIRLPIFDAGRNRANLRAAEVAREMALAQYERAIQGAFREVMDALAERATLAERLAAQRSLLAATRRSFELSEARFRLGADSYLAVLDAQRSLYAAQQGLIALELAEQANRIALFRALGGQWRPRPEAAPGLS